MKLQGRIPVEPLDDDRLVRIERNIVTGAAERAQLSHRSPRRLFAFSAAALAAVAAAVVGYALHPGATTTVASTPVTIGAQTVAVSTDAQHSTLDIGDATITSDPATHFEVVRPDGGVTVELALGKVELSVKKRHDRPRFEVHAGDTHVVVVGTKFSVEYDGKNRVDVRVTEGIVRVERASDVAKVVAGNEWTSTGGLIALATAPTQPSPTEAIAIDDPKLRDHHAAVPETQHVEPHATSDGATTGVAAKHPVDPTHTMTHGDLKAAIRDVTVEVTVDAPTTDPQAAISFYVGNVAHSDDYGVKRGNLYSMAVVQQKLGRDAEADHTLDSVVEREGGGKEYVAGLWLRVRIRCLASIDDRCKQAARTYLQHAPDGPGASVAQRIIVE